MGIEQPGVVDAIGMDNSSGEVVLTILDVLSWDDPSHLRMLQEKLNRYLGFIEQGELVKQYPDAANRRVRIDVYCRYRPSVDAVSALDGARQVVQSYGASLFWSFHDA